ncbi:MAG TPA: ABC transporter permease [Vicinamibacterales bacterium]|nr:ABC transporter permease [Vicinamibacterales bacterium]
MTALLHDLRYACRTLIRSPGFSLAIILTLALGIGANTGMFSFVRGILLRPLPYQQPDRLVLIEAEHDVSGVREPVRSYFSLPELDIFRRMPSFESVALYATDQGVLSAGASPEPLEFATVSDAFFTTLRGDVRLGRTFDSSDDQAPSLVISERLWRRVFGASPDVIGRSVVLNSTRGDGTQRARWRQLPFTIVGVVDRSFQFPSPQTDAWTTAGFVRTLNPRCCSFSPIARLKDDVSTIQVRTENTGMARELNLANNQAHAGVRTKVVGLHDALVRSLRPSLLVLFAAVALVLCVTCANAMNLLIARNTGRAREMAVRLALGASRHQLVRQLIIEYGVLATIGGTVGIAIAIGMVETLSRLKPVEVPRLDDVHVDTSVLAFTYITVALTTVLTALYPALQSTRPDALRASGVAASHGVGGRRVRRALTVGQLAVSVVLLVGSLLLGRSLVRLLQTDLGVEVDHAVTASLSLSSNRDLTGDQQLAVVNRVLDDVRTLPGVTAAGIGTVLPPAESRIVLTLRGDNAISYQAAAIPATPGYFQALGIRLLKGRLFTDADDENHPPVMIMSADTARHFFGEGDPLGRTLSLPVFRDGRTRNAAMTLVGVIAEVKYSGLEKPADNSIFRPFAQQPWPNVFLIARTQGETRTLTSALSRRIGQLDAAIVVAKVSPLEAVVLAAAAQPRLRTVVIGGLAGLALALAAVGLYGVISRSVTQRMNEIGLRMALGATWTDITRMVIGEGMVLAVAGVVLGIALSYASTRVLAAFLYGVTPTDVVSFAVASSSLLAFALIASYLPARRASRIDPAVALRAE